MICGARGPLTEPGTARWPRASTRRVGGAQDRSAPAGAPDEDFAALSDPDYIEARLLGRPPTCAAATSAAAPRCPLLSARKFWHALGFPVVDTDDELFTEADQKALAAVAGWSGTGARRGRPRWR